MPVCSDRPGAEHPGVAAIADLIDALRARQPVPVKVEAEADPAMAGRTVYRIVGPSRAAVQREVSRIMGDVEDAGGFATFLGPAAVAGSFFALGEAILTGEAA